MMFRYRVADLLLARQKRNREHAHLAPTYPNNRSEEPSRVEEDFWGRDLSNESRAQPGLLGEFLTLVAEAVNQTKKLLQAHQ